MIVFDRASRRYGAKYALRDFTLSVPKGQTVGLLGPNGAGKSTAIRLLTGTLAPSGGRIMLGGHDVLAAPMEARRLLGYLPENAPLSDEMTVREALTFAAGAHGIAPGRIPARMDETAALTGLGQVLDRRIGNLSRGFRQRTALGQALVHDPDVVILDEPTQGLDPVQSSELRALIRDLGKQRTVLFSSHILSDIEQTCHRAVILHEGEMRADLMLQDEQSQVLDAVILSGEGRLMPALRSLPGAEKVEALPDHEKGQTHVVITARRDAPIQRQLFTLLTALDAPILRLTPVRRSLEDIFLNAIQSTETKGTDQP